MAETFQSKNIIVLFLFPLLADTTKLTRDVPVSLHVYSQRVSKVQEEIGLQWPNGVVTYYLDNNTYDYYVSNRVRMSMNSLESASCVRFKPILIKPDGKLPTTSWIHLTNPTGERKCVHKPIYKDNGEIVFVLGYDCLKNRDILHSLLHAIGFEDEVSHPRRDQYIRVLWNNIQPEYRQLFQLRRKLGKSSQLLVEYDPQSVMHFHDRAFTMNGQATIMPLVPGLLISPSDELSQLDKMKLRLLFDRECNKRKVGDMLDTCKMMVRPKVVSKEKKPQLGEKSEEDEEIGNDEGKEPGIKGSEENINKEEEEPKKKLNEEETKNEHEKETKSEHEEETKIEHEEETKSKDEEESKNIINEEEEKINDEEDIKNKANTNVFKEENEENTDSTFKKGYRINNH